MFCLPGPLPPNEKLTRLYSRQSSDYVHDLAHFISALYKPRANKRHLTVFPRRCKRVDSRKVQTKTLAERVTNLKKDKLKKDKKQNGHNCIHAVHAMFSIISLTTQTENANGKRFFLFITNEWINDRSLKLLRYTFLLTWFCLKWLILYQVWLIQCTISFFYYFLGN